MTPTAHSDSPAPRVVLAAHAAHAVFAVPAAHAVLAVPAARAVFAAALPAVFAAALLGALAPPLAAQSALLPGKSRLDPRAPSVGVGVDGRVVVTFVDDTTIHACISTDGGTTFGDPETVSKEKALMAAGPRRPRVAVTPAGIVVTAISGAKLKGQDGDLNAWFSADGARWARKVRVPDVADAALEGLHGMAAGPGDRVVAVWLDHREGKRNHHVRAAASDDGGRTWADDVLVYASPDGAVCPCCTPSVVVDHEGRAHAMWRNDLDGNRDMYVATSDARVSAFGAPRAVDAASWALRQCPMQGGEMAVDAKGAIEAVWFHKGRVLRASLDADGRPGAPGTLATGRDAGIAAGPEGVTRLHVDGDRLVISTEPDADPELEAAPARREPAAALTFTGRNPMLAGAPDGRGPVVLFYESDEDGAGRIQVVAIQPRAP